MALCAECRRDFKTVDIKDGFCKECFKKIEALKLEQRSSKIMLTTESSPQLEITERIEIITAECVFGMNIFKDLFAGIRDIVGGRSNATQNILKDSRKMVLNELKKEACLLGANAVVAVDLNYSEFSGGGKSMLLVIATGTAVKIKI